MNTTVIDTMIKAKATKQAEAEIQELHSILKSWADKHKTDKSNFLEFDNYITVYRYGITDLAQEEDRRAICTEINTGFSTFQFRWKRERVKYLINQMTTDLIEKVSLLG